MVTSKFIFIVKIPQGSISEYLHHSGFSDPAGYIVDQNPN
jgi:hypothetical protein